ncbi:MAG: CidA/LrgA family protein [Gammaproteobacteria bacterium]|nr:CidA/LrgA family protein [Gammaproteobacteria bacterium]
MLNAWLWLLGYQLIGTALMHFLLWPIPGPVAGMVLLTCHLMLRQASAFTEQLASSLIQYLPLLFVPAATGVVAHLDLVSGSLGAMALVIALSTLLSLWATGWVFCRLARKVAPAEAAERRG